MEVKLQKLVDISQIKQASIDVDFIYDEIEIEDMDFETDVETEQLVFRYQCPCGDRFLITLQYLFQNRYTFEQRDSCIAVCPSCSLKIKVVFDQDFILDFIQSNDLQEQTKEW